MLWGLSDFRPHSSPDPFGATLPPEEGMDFFDKLKKASRVYGSLFG